MNRAALGRDPDEDPDLFPGCPLNVSPWRHAAISPEEYQQFVALVEARSLRSLRRQFDYGRRVRSQTGLVELRHWVERVLCSRGDGVYPQSDVAAAFEIAACETLAGEWPELHLLSPDPLLISGEVNRTLLYRCLLDTRLASRQKAGFFPLLRRYYRRHMDWIVARAQQDTPGDQQGPSAWEQVAGSFLDDLCAAVPLPVGEGGSQAGSADVVKLQIEMDQLRRDRTGLEGDLEFAEDRAHRAHQRIRKLETAADASRRQLREMADAADKLRQERRMRIRLEREVTTAQKELTHLQHEYVKLDRRMQDMASRLARAHEPAGASPLVVDIDAMRNMPAGRVLGLDDEATAAQIGEVRRRFAVIFHPDRVKQLPDWAQHMCDQILAMVNEACDRLQP